MRSTICIALAVVLSGFMASVSTAQNGGNQGGGNQGGGNQGGGNGGQFPGGILISPEGVIDRAVVIPGNGAALQKQLKQTAQRDLPADLNRPSALRKVSLGQLDAEIERRLIAGDPLPPDVRFLAGLTRIDLVFVTDDGNDVVIAGPAEGFAAINGGRFVGVESGRPVLCLDDLLVALRSAADQKAVGCSIDPDPQRLRDSQQWLKQNSAPATVDIVRARLERMVTLQGLWNVTLFGVPEDSRMAVAMVEADYLMKRLAIGIDNPGIRGLKSSLALAGPGDNMMRRWWFAPHYDAITRNEDGTAFHFSGSRIRLFAQEELMDDGGNLIDADFSQASSEKFARLFNERIDELTRRVPAFADLQNMFDVLITAAVIQDCQQKETLHWKPTALIDDSQLPTASYVTPRETTPMLNARSSGASLVIGAFSGGITFQSRQVLRQVKAATDADVSRQLQTPPRTASTTASWWWD